MPRGLKAPQLADDVVRLEPLHRGLAEEMRWVIDGDPGIRRFTYVPSSPGPDFFDRWLGRYEDGWQNESSAGFAVRQVDDGRLVGFAAYVRLDLAKSEGELGYMVEAAVRGRGMATRAVRLLTDWGLAELRLQRIELRIDTANEASARVAERAGYRLDGVLRNLSFKEGQRTDTAVWSRLPSD